MEFDPEKETGEVGGWGAADQEEREEAKGIYTASDDGEQLGRGVRVRRCS
jgi:hypothetical protein